MQTIPVRSHTGPDTAHDDIATALLIAMAQSSDGVTATSAARALYNVETPTPEQRQTALDKLRALAATGRLVRDTKPNRRVVDIFDQDVPRRYLKGDPDRTAGSAIANADRSRAPKAGCTR